MSKTRILLFILSAILVLLALYFFIGFNTTNAQTTSPAPSTSTTPSSSQNVKEGFKKKDLNNIQKIIWKGYANKPSMVSFIYRSRTLNEKDKNSLNQFINRSKDTLNQMYNYCENNKCKKVPQDMIKKIYDQLVDKNNIKSMAYYITNSLTINDSDKKLLFVYIREINKQLKEMLLNCKGPKGNVICN